MYDERLKTTCRGARRRIAARWSGPAGAAHVRLVAVTKGHAAGGGSCARRRAGMTDVGENRVQELDEKRAAVPPDAGRRPGT
jgi:uncharacterized pyridoxal phosphate-containing UPF0001 family protein